MRLQIGIEYIAMFASSALLITIALASAAYMLSFTSQPASGTAYRPYTPIASPCFITTGMECYGASVDTATDPIVYVVFTNAEGTDMAFPANSFTMWLSGPKHGNAYVGSCTTQGNQPSEAANGAKVECTANIPEGEVSPGEQLNSVFTIGYELCQRSVCQAELNVTGTATVYAS